MVTEGVKKNEADIGPSYSGHCLNLIEYFAARFFFPFFFLPGMSSLHSSSAVQRAGRSRRRRRDVNQAGGAKISRRRREGGEFEPLSIATSGQFEMNDAVCLGGSLEKV